VASAELGDAFSPLSTVKTRGLTDVTLLL